MSLTSQQEAFAQAVASGKSQADAYRIAYDCKRSKPETIIQNASRLMADSNIAARVAELRAELSQRALWKREDSVRVLVQIADDTEASPKDKTQAIKVLNDMHGFNAPLKVEHSGQVTQITRRIIDVAEGENG